MKKLIVNYVGFALLGLISWNAQAQLGYQEYRHIHINGAHLDDAQILELDQELGYVIPNGFYWLNADTGEWGYEGNDEVLGYIYSENDPRSVAGEQTQQAAPSNTGSSRPYISNDTGTGSAVIDPNGCSYVSAGGMTFKSCD